MKRDPRSPYFSLAYDIDENREALNKVAKHIVWKLRRIANMIKKRPELLITMSDKHWYVAPSFEIQSVDVITTPIFLITLDKVYNHFKAMNRFKKIAKWEK